jgi:SAM-dependent methyltransferase
VSSLYVERRPSAGLGSRTSESEGKRAALATFYAPLHFLTALEAAERLAAPARDAVRRVHDLGCGTGAAGAAFALACSGGVEVLGIDRSGWALREARHTLAAFGLRGRPRRASIPESLPRLRPGDALVLGWMANELTQPARVRLLDFVAEAVAAGHPLLVLEPLARSIAPWWPSWAAALGPRGARDLELKFTAELPEWVARLDEASGLDHSTLGARVLLAPG